MKEIKAYQCDHCEKKYFSKSYMKKHESICFFNPKSKSCVTCEFFLIRTDPHFGQTRGCGKDINIDSELKTKCDLHKEEDDDQTFRHLRFA